jgi:hypothetical protein
LLKNESSVNIGEISTEGLIYLMGGTLLVNKENCDHK